MLAPQHPTEDQIEEFIISGIEQCASQSDKGWSLGEIIEHLAEIIRIAQVMLAASKAAA